MKGEMEFKACPEDYQCFRCGFDHYFEALYRVSASVNPVEFLDVKGFTLPHGYYLHQGHTWIKLEEDATVRIGLDDFILRALGPLDRIEAPLAGETMSRDTPQITLRRGDNAAQALAPVSGVVTDINPVLRESGLDSSMGPYTWGWIARIHCERLQQELKTALLGIEATQFMEFEAEALFSRIAESRGPLAADGGELAPDLCGNLPDLDWKELAQSFLRS
jgi:glycine cleavage system H lipoate-binding protein